ncbi:divalent-cation tolerance protein CutA [Fluviibacterium sp. DFM31]|uniref:Divalent-cation tolerance protein CutA n=1 Tax=Meridianimarinicoccus marinus TaxID=3231483 RepID=A0ABV3L6X2_9RHOB
MPTITLMRVTCPDDDSARAITRAALTERLAACANLGAITAEFHWDNALNSAAEIVVLFKTRPELAEPLAAQIRKAHPYDLPAITWWEVQTDAATADWVASETGAHSASR